MTTGDMADCVRHCEYGKAERESDPKQAYTDGWKGCRKYGTSTSPENQPERSHKLSKSSLLNGHVCHSFPKLFDRYCASSLHTPTTLRGHHVRLQIAQPSRDRERDSAHDDR